MEKQFGKISKGDEERHAMMLFPMEENLLKINRKYSSSNSRRLREAIFIALHQNLRYHFENEGSNRQMEVSDET